MTSTLNFSISDHKLLGSDVIPLITSKNNIEFNANLPDTIIIHYTAGRSAETSARFLQDENVKASAHIVIGRNGEIYQIVPFNKIAWHAGVSQFGNRKNFNKYAIGIELDNAGVLTKVGTEYLSWFGEKYQANDVIYAKHRNENSPKYWHVYTPKQIEACEQVVKLLITSYGINTILGHEEIAVGRKQDPGPAFPLDKFRTNLLSLDRDEETPISYEGTHKVIASLLNIREGAGTAFKKVAQPLKQGAEVKILEEKDGWCKVETKITGWVSKGHLDI
ncbi:MAG: N-acetylmuramoyl-L-alanine amidase [Salinivirgaceae bacterium]|nr:N-acetylmuramoyl-L-alanine amidase [Salinivirgaceae bacterium]